MASSKRVGDNWVKALSGINNKRGKLPPDYPGDWKTFNELFAEYAFGANKLRAILQEGIKNGTFEAYEGCQPNVMGKLARAVWYRPI